MLGDTALCRHRMMRSLCPICRKATVKTCWRAATKRERAWIAVMSISLMGYCIFAAYMFHTSAAFRQGLAAFFGIR